jgi:hypothetical protein
MRDKLRNSKDGHWERNCWRGSKMATQPEKALVLENHSK